MSLLWKKGIFDSASQLMDHINPEDLRMLHDRVLIRDLGDPEFEGSIYIPETSQDKILHDGARLRIGVVLSVGPGDKFTEHGVSDEGEVYRRLITRQCDRCHGEQYVYGVDSLGVHFVLHACLGCDGEGRIPVVIPPQCKAGDKVLYDRRKEAEINVCGERFSMVNAEQSVIAVLED